MPDLVPGIHAFSASQPATRGWPGHRRAKRRRSSNGYARPWRCGSALLAAVLDGRLEREAGVPGEEDPGVLRHLGDEGIDHRLAQRLGVDAGEMRLGQD